MEPLGPRSTAACSLTVNGRAAIGTDEKEFAASAKNWQAIQNQIAALSTLAHDPTAYPRAVSSTATASRQRHQTQAGRWRPPENQSDTSLLPRPPGSGRVPAERGQGKEENASIVWPTNVSYLGVCQLH